MTSRTEQQRETIRHLLAYHGPMAATELSLRMRVKENIVRRLLRHKWFQSGDGAFLLSAEGAAKPLLGVQQ